MAGLHARTALTHVRCRLERAEEKYLEEAAAFDEYTYEAETRREAAKEFARKYELLGTLGSGSFAKVCRLCRFARLVGNGRFDHISVAMATGDGGEGRGRQRVCHQDNFCRGRA
jgi:hypothetical protein